MSMIQVNSGAYSEKLLESELFLKESTDTHKLCLPFILHADDVDGDNFGERVCAFKSVYSSSAAKKENNKFNFI